MSTKMITGVVERVLVRERENGADAFGNTHTRALSIGGQWFNFSGGTKPIWNVKIGDGFKVLGAGSEVAFKATTTVSKTNGKEYTNCSGLMVINLVEGENSPPAGKGGSSGGASQGGQSSGGSYQTKQPFDQEGTATGHAVNGAFNFLITQGVSPTNENIIKYGKMVHNVSERINTEFKEKYEKVSKNYKAMTGNSVLNACKFADAENFEQSVFDLAIDFLDNVVPEIAAHVKGEVKQAPPVKVSRAVPAKKAATKAAPVQKEEFEEDESSDLPF